MLITDADTAPLYVGAFAGMRVFGLLGLVLGPLAISYFFVLLRMYRDEYGGDAVSSDSSR